MYRLIDELLGFSKRDSKIKDWGEIQHNNFNKKKKKKKVIIILRAANLDNEHKKYSKH